MAHGGRDTGGGDTALDTVATLPANSSAANWLLGDLHAEVQTTLLDEEFSFIDGLIGHAGTAGTGAAGGPLAMQYAEVSFTDDDPTGGEALGYAPQVHKSLPPLLKAPPAAAASGVWTAWASGDYGTGSFAGTASNFGFGYNSGGGEVGLDYRKGDWLIGGASQYVRSNVSQDITGDSSAIDSVRLGGYASYRPGPWSFTGVIGGGWHFISTDRLTVLPMPATSSYDAQSFNAGFEAARRYDLWGGVLQPLAGLVYTNLHANAFTESGDPFLDLAGQSSDLNALKGYAGARAWKSFEIAPGLIVTPEVNARVLYDFLDNEGSFTALFAADPTATTFPVSGLASGRTAGLFGAGLSLSWAPNWRAIAAYSAEIRDASTDQHVSGGFKVTW